MTTKKYTVSVDYSLSVKKLVKLGEYDWVNDNITSDNFPSTEKGKKKLDVTLMGFNKKHSSKWVIKHLKSKGYRPATIKELLSLGVQHPDLQRKDWIVALGSTWRSPGGCLGVPCLDRYGSDRGLSLAWFGGGWRPDWRFAAVKVSGKLKPSVTGDASDALTLGDLVSDMDKLVNDFYKASDEIIKKMKKYDQLTK